jgi:ankyrin repeat protein
VVRCVSQRTLPVVKHVSRCLHIVSFTVLQSSIIICYIVDVMRRTVHVGNASQLASSDILSTDSDSESILTNSVISGYESGSTENKAKTKRHDCESSVRSQKQCVDIATCDVVSDAVHGNVDAVRKWLHGDGRHNVKKQVVVLLRAARYGHTDICQLVIDCDTVSTDNLTTALQQACYWGHLSVVQLIVSTLGQNCNSQLLEHILFYAALRCRTEVVNWLLSLTRPTDADYMRCNLILASARGDLTCVTQLVNNIGRDVTDVMSQALWTACYWGRVDIVDWLMTHTSADVNYSRVIYNNIGNMTSLALACFGGRMAVVKRLLIDETLPCDVNMVTGKRCNTALHEVIWNTQKTPLHLSCYKGDTTAVGEVVYESDVNLQDKEGKTAMHLAGIGGHLDTVKVLLSVFADTNITNDYGCTPVAVCEDWGGSLESANYIHDHLLL